MTDIEIAEKVKLKNIAHMARALKISKSEIELIGKYKAKINLKRITPKGQLILVTAINPTAAGEGKTTVSIGLADALHALKKNVCLALREPSLGPVFGVKGGATGGGYSQIAPMVDINLHFTGDMHAITAANNLLCAAIDNHIFQGNALGIKPETICFNRCLDINDRALRSVTICANGDGEKRTEKFNITAASEVMAILCLAKDAEDLKTRLGNIVVAKNNLGKYVYAHDLNAHGAMAALLADAIKPNLVQTLEGTPAIVHGGPFANIAHGCNSIIATYTALTLADYVVTEAGFGADLGAEKFLDTKCRVAGIEPQAIVLVATVRALKMHGGAKKAELASEDLSALKAGVPNLVHHIKTLAKVYNKPVVVALNKFNTDTDAEIEMIKTAALNVGAKFAISSAYENGGKGAVQLAKAVLEACQTASSLTFAYNLNEKLETKILKVAKKVYGGAGIELSSIAKEKITEIETAGYKNLPVIIAKTQYSLSDNKNLLGAPKNFVVNINDIELRAGAGFVVAVAGKMLLMPGLSKKPALENIDVKDNSIIGIF